MFKQIRYLPAGPEFGFILYKKPVGGLVALVHNNLNYEVDELTSKDLACLTSLRIWQDFNKDVRTFWKTLKAMDDKTREVFTKFNLTNKDLKCVDTFKMWTELNETVGPMASDKLTAFARFTLSNGEEQK